jgi:hypothetical protein
MATWTRNELVLTGSLVGRLQFQAAVAGSNGAMDFDRLVPMPSSLAIECSTDTELGLASVDAGRFRQLAGLAWFGRDYLDVRTPGDLRARLLLEQPAVAALGDQAYANIGAYGVPTWYEWRVLHWGTKGNATCIECADRAGMLMYWFRTANGTPRPLVGLVTDLAARYGLALASTALAQDRDEPEVLAGDPGQLLDSLTLARSEAV